MTMCSLTISPDHHHRMSPSWWHTRLSTLLSPHRHLYPVFWQQRADDEWDEMASSSFIWTMHVDDEDPGSIRVLLINSIWQSKYCWQLSSDQVMFSARSILHYHVSPGDLSLSLWWWRPLGEEPEVTPVWGHTAPGHPGSPDSQAHIRSSGQSVKSKEWHSRCESYRVTSAFTFLTRAPLLTRSCLAAPSCWHLLSPVRWGWGDTSDQRQGQGARHLIIWAVSASCPQEYLTGCLDILSYSRQIIMF